MKYRIEISEESLRIIGLAVEEYMRIRMGQFETLSEDLVYEGKDRGKLYEDQYKFGVYNERSRSVEKMFNLGYQMAFPPFGNRERQHDSWGTCIDLVHAIEHQQWLDAPEGKKRGTRHHISLPRACSAGQRAVPENREGGRMNCLSCENYIPLDPPIQRTDSNGQTYEVPGLCKIGADHIISGFPVYLPTAKCDKITEAPLQNGS